MWRHLSSLSGKFAYRARFQASSGHSDSANRPGYEAGTPALSRKFMEAYLPHHCPPPHFSPTRTIISRKLSRKLKTNINVSLKTVHGLCRIVNCKQFHRIDRSKQKNNDQLIEENWEDGYLSLVPLLPLSLSPSPSLTRLTENNLLAL